MRLRSPAVSRPRTSPPCRRRVRPSPPPSSRPPRSSGSRCRRATGPHGRGRRRGDRSAGGEYHAITPSAHPRHPRAVARRRPVRPQAVPRPTAATACSTCPIVGKAGLPAFVDGNGDCADDNVLAVAVNITVVNPGSVGYLEAFGKGETPVADLDPQLQAGRVRRQHGDPAPRMRRRALDPPGARRARRRPMSWSTSSAGSPRARSATRGARLEPSGPGRIFDSRENAFECGLRSPAASSARSTSAAPPPSTPVSLVVPQRSQRGRRARQRHRRQRHPEQRSPTFVSLLPAPSCRRSAPPATSTCRRRPGPLEPGDRADSSADGKHLGLQQGRQHPRDPRRDGLLRPASRRHHDVAA